MDFALSEDERIAQSEARRFAEQVLNQSCSHGPQEFPYELFKQLGSFGLFGALVPNEYGGQESSTQLVTAVLEGLGAACDDYGLLHSAVTQMLCAAALAAFGSEEQKESWLPRVCAGDVMMAQAMTEPSSGSDTQNLATRAEVRERSVLLNGSKVFTSNVPLADIALVFAVTDADRNFLNKTSCLLVDLESPGVERTGPMSKMGLHTLQNGELFFDDVELSTSCFVGRRGQGFQIFSDAMVLERTLLFATFVGRLERVLDMTIDFVRSRKSGGAAISKHQAVSHKIADMRVNLELARLAVYKAAWRRDQGDSPFLEASIAKLFTSESFRQACMDAIQLHGGYGYMTEYKIEAELRDGFASTLYSGTSEIQRNIIARLSGLR